MRLIKENDRRQAVACQGSLTQSRHIIADGFIHRLIGY